MSRSTQNSLRLLSALAFAALAACGDDPPGDADVSADVASDGSGTDVTDIGGGDADADDTADEVAPDGGDDADTGDDADEGVDGGDDTADAADTTPERVLDPWPTRPTLPACGTATDWPGWIAAPGESGPGEALATTARRLERQYHAFNTFGVGANRELSVSVEDTESRELIEQFIRDTDEWDFEAWSGRSPGDVITSYSKVAGAYAGVGVASDSFRYLTMLREGAPCDDLERARAFLSEDLDALHMATAITGVEGVIARGFARSSQPGTQYEPVPLFDESGSALPAEKNNGTWRADASGEYPDFMWEDSCSRDMLIGWAIGYAAIWEAIRDDDAFTDAQRQRLQADATAIARSLMTTQASGYDLEIRDADGRMTYHGILNEQSIDRAYVAGIKNGFNALMSLGIMAGLAFVSEQPDIEAYIYDTLIDERHFDVLVVREMNLLDLGFGSNFSMYNMATQGGWLAMRYLRDPQARAAARESVRTAIYDRGGSRQPREQKQTFFDFTYLAAVTGESVFSPPEAPLEPTPLANGLETLSEWNTMPYWDFGHDNCDEAEVASGDCVGDDGTPIHVLGDMGRNGDIVAEAPVPMRIRPASNYWWRSNPYKPNGGGTGAGLYPGSDFRFVYWMGRYFTQP
ncbi:MAG: hypothetical protein H6699_04825 [Myxococcales bacterium]|nr:hypothetical protein [Myxococcales bacterium]